MDILTKLKYFKILLAPDQNHLANLFQLKDLIAKTYFNFYFNFMPVSCERHTQKTVHQCTKMRQVYTITHVFLPRPPSTKKLSKRMDFSVWEGTMPRYPNLTLDKNGP